LQVSAVSSCRCDGLTATVEAAAATAVVVMVTTEVFVLGARPHLYENYCSSSYNAKKSHRTYVPARPEDEEKHANFA
jgi:hypothetical protein